jgi:hypothetical protein
MDMDVDVVVADNSIPSRAVLLVNSGGDASTVSFSPRWVATYASALLRTTFITAARKGTGPDLMLGGGFNAGMALNEGGANPVFGARAEYYEGNRYSCAADVDGDLDLDIVHSNIAYREVYW